MTVEELKNIGETELNTVYFGDCLEGMKYIPSNSVDAVICDLPYQTTACVWDVIIPFESLWKEYYRVAKQNAPFILFAAEPFTSQLVMSNLKDYRQKLTWLKTRPTNVMNAKKMFMNWTEDILVFYRSLPTFNPQMRTDGVFTGAKVLHTTTDRARGTLGQTGEKEGYVHEGNGGLFYPKTVLEFSNVHVGSDNYHHPTQKPVKLIEYLIKTYTNKGDLVLDNCMGSGTTAVAAMNLDRNFIGFEKNDEYYKILTDRINSHIVQNVLF